MTTKTAGYIVQKGFESAGLCALGQSVSAGQMSRGIDALQDIINLWGTQGLKLWLQQIVPVPLEATRNTYSLGPGGDVDMTKPLSVLQGTYILPSGTRQPLNVLAREEYIRLPLYNSYGAINSYFTNKKVDVTEVSFWNPPDAQAALGTVELLCRLQADNPTVSTDSSGFSEEWVIALRWAVADEVCTGQPDSIMQRCAQRAGAYREALEAFDVEDAPMYFQVDQRVQQGTNSFI